MHNKRKRNFNLVMTLIFIVLFCTIFMFPFYIKYVDKQKNDTFNDQKLLIIENFDIEYGDNYDGKYVIMKVGDVYRPAYSFEPIEISEFQKLMTYTNSNSDSLKIDHSGTFTALKVGVANVTVTSVKNPELKREMSVKIVAQNNNLNFTYDILAKKQVYGIGQIVKLDYVAVGMISLGGFNWSSSNPAVATVEDGYVKALSMGKTTITITSKYDDTYSKSVDVEVKGYYNVSKVEKIEFEDIVKVDIVNYNIEKFIKYGACIGNKVTVTANSDQDEANVIYYEFSDNDMIKRISSTSNSITFECLKTGRITLRAISSYFSDKYEELTFDVLNFDPMGSFELASPSNSRFVENGNEKFVELEYGKLLPVIIESDNKIVPCEDLIIESSNTSSVIVVKNYIKAVGNGTSVITIKNKYDDSYSLSFTAKVVTNSENKFSMVELLQAINIKKNGKLQSIVDYDYNIVSPSDIIEFDLSIYPIYATNKFINVISVTNEKISNVEVDEKNHITISFNELGRTSLIIECIENPNLSLQYDFEVVNNDEVKYTINPSKLLERGQTGNCNVVLENGLKGVEVTYTSSDPSIVSVGHAGELVGLGYGTATISIHATDGVTSFDESFEVECVKEHSLYDALKAFKSVVKMNGTEINLNEKLMYIGDSFTIDVSFTPSNHPFGKYHEVKIEKPEILSVDKNNNKYTFKCLKSGTTKVTVYPYANPDFSVEYTVTIANIMPKFMFVSVPDKVMYVEDRYQFGYLIDWRATYSNVDIIIGDDSIVGIEDDYLVIKKAGKTYVSFIIDDNDDNTVSYVQTLNIEAFDHSTGVKLERYGYGNFIVRIISQVICALIIGILAIVIASRKPLKLNSVLNYVVVICGILCLLILCSVLRMSIKPLGYEKYDMLTNIISYVAGLFIGFVIYLLRNRKEKSENA